MSCQAVMSQSAVSCGLAWVETVPLCCHVTRMVARLLRQPVLQVLTDLRVWLRPVCTHILVDFQQLQSNKKQSQFRVSL